LSYTDGGNTVSFTQAGLYSFDVLYYESDTNFGVEVGSNLLPDNGYGYGNALTAANFYQSIPPAVVPERCSLAMVGIGAATGLAFRSWKRRKSERTRPSGR
jgi:hypothetical protein